MGSPVSYIPYLTNGTDVLPASGFQPVPGSCNGNNQPPSITCPENVTLDCSIGIPEPNTESVIVLGTCPVMSVTWEEMKLQARPVQARLQLYVPIKQLTPVVIWQPAHKQLRYRILHHQH